MDFLDLINALIAFQKAMGDQPFTWDATSYRYGGSTLTIEVEISDKNAELLRQAREMFADR